MGSASMKWAVGGIGAGLILMVTSGCTYNCGEVLACEFLAGTGGGSGTGGAGGSGGGEPDPCPEDPADGVVAAECGVWVSVSLGDDSQPGTQMEPVRTLARAVEQAQLGTGRIYACGETYVGPFELPSGISLSGGFTCDDHGWTYVGKGKPAILVSTVPDAYALTLLQGDGTALLTDLEIEVADAQKPGGSSIAVFSFGTRAVIRRAHLMAGNGADGLDGEPGDHNGAPAKKGLPGNDGEYACTNDSGLGGEGVTLQCPAAAEATAGGGGGEGGYEGANDGFAGLLPPDPNNLGYGAGGKGESASQACTGGSSGAQGIAGLHGFGAKGDGHLTVDGPVGVSGGDGAPGEPGQGGGGGGGSLGSALCGGKQGGAGGGSGGTGGCGGKAGRGGKPGGASIGLAAVAGLIRVQDVRITTGNGGKGGNGGAGQQGGQAGLPGKGGLGFGGAGGAKSGCGGGIGGNGGSGGHGGGGHGGHTLALAFSGDGFIEELIPVKVVFGEKGQGGNGGNPAIVASTGEPGTASQKTPLLP